MYYGSPLFTHTKSFSQLLQQVTLDIKKDNVLHIFNDRRTTNGNPPNELAISARGERRFEVVGEPWLDDTGSFYLANVDIIDQRQEEISSNHVEQAKELYDTIPSLVQEWTKLVLKSKKSTLAGMNQRLQDIGPMPQTSLKDRAIWVAVILVRLTRYHGAPVLDLGQPEIECVGH